MDTKLSQLDQLLKFMLDTLQQGKDFTLEQAPLFAKELLRLYFWESIFWIALGVVVIIAGAVVSRIFKRIEPGLPKSDWSQFDQNDARQWRIATNVASWFVGLSLIFQNIYYAIEVTVAPRVVLIYQLKDLIHDAVK